MCGAGRPIQMDAIVVFVQKSVAAHMLHGASHLVVCACVQTSSASQSNGSSIAIPDSSSQSTGSSAVPATATTGSRVFRSEGCQGQQQQSLFSRNHDSKRSRGSHGSWFAHCL